MKRILILSYYYKHKNAMASVRAIKLAKYFAKAGCDVTVLTSNQQDTWTKEYLTPVADPKITEIYAPEVKRWSKIKGYLNHRKQAGQARLAKQKAAPKEGNKAAPVRVSLKTKIKRFLSWVFYFNIAKQEDICMFKGLKKAFLQEKLPQYDTVIATYPTYGAFLMGMWLKKHGHCKQLIADFRDPLYNPGFRSVKQEADYDFRCQKRILKAADRLVCVSHGIADGILQAEPGFSKPVDVITNGFDPEDVGENNIPVEFDKEKLHFVYTGTLYHGKRCVDMLAAVLRELIDEGKLTADRFAFQYAGPDFGELLEQLKAYGLEETAVDHGFVSREQAIAMQKQADALLLLTWNEKDYQGVVPGKLFEYMAIGTAPILALVTGDVAESEVAQLVRESKAGVACEAANPGDGKLLKEYVLRLFDRETNCESNVEQYSYKAICSRYLALM